MADANFDGATFDGDARFGGATFSGDARFDGATFSGDAGFYGASFGGVARFDGATFSRPVNFEGATFSPWEDSLSFGGSRVTSPDDEHVWPTGWGPEPNGSGGYTVARANDAGQS